MRMGNPVTIFSLHRVLANGAGEPERHQRKLDRLGTGSRPALINHFGESEYGRRRRSTVRRSGPGARVLSSAAANGRVPWACPGASLSVRRYRHARLVGTLECSQSPGPGSQEFDLRIGSCSRLFRRPPPKASRPNGMRLEPGAVQYAGSLDWQILVDLEFHAVRPAGRSIDPSRTSSAAYARAASMSSDCMAG